jgi:hypothetical protein
MSIESSRVFQNYDAGGARRTAEKKETGIARSGWRTFTYQPEKADSNFPPITLSKGSVLDFLERNGQGFSWWQRASNEEMSVRLRSIVAKPLPGDKGKTADEIFRRAFEGSSETSQPTSTKTSLNTRENSSGPTKKPTRARPPTGSAVQQVTSPRTPAPSTAGGPAMSSASPRASRSTVPGLRPLEMADAHRQDEALRSFQTTPSHSLLGSPSSESLDSSGSLDSTPRESDDAVVQRNPTLIGEREVLTGKLAGESSFGFRTKTGPGGQSLKPVQVEEIIRRAFNKAIIGNTGTWSPGTAKNYTGDLGEGTAAINQSRIVLQLNQPQKQLQQFQHL